MKPRLPFAVLSLAFIGCSHKAADQPAPPSKTNLAEAPPAAPDLAAQATAPDSPALALSMCGAKAVWQTKIDKPDQLRAWPCIGPNDGRNDELCPWGCTDSGEGHATTIVQPAQLRPWERESKVGLTLQRGAGRPYCLNVPSAFAFDDKESLGAVEADLDGDGTDDLLIAYSPSYNSVGRSYANVLVIHGARPTRVLAGILMLPDPEDLENSFRGVAEFRANDAPYGWKERHWPLALLGRTDARSPCRLLQMDLDTTGNGCNGCTAGGPTLATFRLLDVGHGGVTTDHQGVLWKRLPD